MTTHSVLFVDDETDILDALSRVFRKEGYRIRVATSAIEGWALLAVEPSDLIVCDQNMPGVTGVEFLTRVEQDHPDTVRIVLTGHADAEAAIAAINHGKVHRFLTKPWRNDELRLMVRESLNQRDMVLENRRLHELVLKQNEQLKEMNFGLERKVQERTTEVNEKNRELARLYSDLDESFDDSIRVFAGLMELRDSLIGSHSKRVVAASKAIAQALGLARETARDLERAAVLHDVGKIGVPQPILETDDSRLSKNEREILHRHPVLGQAAVQVVDNLRGVGVVIRHHHERFDGTGYPDGLRGGQIPLGARIIAVADAYDYLMYRRGDDQTRTEEWAVMAMESGSSQAFDPDVLSIFLQLHGSWRFDPNQPAEITVDIRDLRPDMVLSRDLYTAGGLLLAPKDTIIKPPYIERIANYHRVDPIRGGIYVYPGSGSPVQ
ncbi:MAG: response regulator [Dehalococcoidia bacterium]|nr:response regulator [Dehalococcoidia bacterium]